jgi:hypothetical protein
MSDQKFRTWDEALRQRRFDLLRGAAQRAAAAAIKAGLSLRVTGSVSRGEVHPWSDLDLVLKKEGVAEEGIWSKWHDVIDATGLGDGVDAPFEDEIFAPLLPGLVGRARQIEEMPVALAPLPDPSVALRTAAIGVIVVVKRFDLEEAKLPGMLTKLGNHSEWYVKRHASRMLDMMEARIETAVKRLAAYHDGGQSAWLDDHGDRDALRSMLERLSSATDAPFQRPALIHQGGAADVHALLTDYNTVGRIDREIDETFLTDAKRITDGMQAWARHLAILCPEAIEALRPPEAPTPTPGP